MSRLIDADAMLARLEEWNTSDSTDKALYNFTLHRILEQPTVDAIEVVRCKDCKHWDAFDIHSTICPNNRRCKGIIGKMYTAPDYYCTYGERKDG